MMEMVTKLPIPAHNSLSFVFKQCLFPVYMYYKTSVAYSGPIDTPNSAKELPSSIKVNLKLIKAPLPHSEGFGGRHSPGRFTVVTFYCFLIEIKNI